MSSVVDEVMRALERRRREGLAGEPVSMRGRLEHNDGAPTAIVEVLLDSGELLSFRGRRELQTEVMH